jgi:hypothetical protein
MAWLGKAWHGRGEVSSTVVYVMVMSVTVLAGFYLLAVL